MRRTFGILASGRGSNALALMEAFESGFLPADLKVVVANKATAQVLERARERGYPAELVPSAKTAREAHEAAVLEVLARHGVQHVLLAGYMRILSPYFLSRFAGTILNIHPSLLPDFPGLHGARRQWEARRSVVGATVHVVDAGVDTGKVVLQGSILAQPDESAEHLAERLLHEVEHVIYPRAVRLLLHRLEEQDA